MEFNINQKMERLLPIVVALLISSCITQKKENQIQTKNDIIEHFIKLVESDVKDDNIDGSFSLAIIHKDSILALESYGNASKNTIFRIGSISKSFAGFLMLQLQQEGILDINDPVEKYLPEIKSLVDYGKYSPITLKQLATHTSGLERESRSRDVNVRFGKIDEWENNLIQAISEICLPLNPSS